MITNLNQTSGLIPASLLQSCTKKGVYRFPWKTIGGVFLFGTCSGLALEPVDLGAAAPFTILAGAAITTTGGGIINGDVGASPIAGSAIALMANQVNGTIYTVDPSGPEGSVVNASYLTNAKSALTTAYNDAAGRTPIPSGTFLNTGIPGTPRQLGGMTLVPGLYKFTDTLLITGANLTLSGGPNDVWIFQCAADLQVGTNVNVILSGGALPRNIFWQVGTSAVIETFASFQGVILASQSVTMKTSSTLDGKAMAFTGGVTFNGIVGTLPEPETPHFTNITRSTLGAVTLDIETTPYFLLTYQTSLTMEPDSWETIHTVTPTSTPWTYVHPAAGATGPKRFYRAFLTPY
jgi:hypothetical protein